MAILLRSALLFVISLVGMSSPASAQSWLAAANPTVPPLGPRAALGAVVWSHGTNLDAEAFTAPSPPYLTTLRRGGWDTFRFNRLRVDDSFTDSPRNLKSEVAKLKGVGYRRVVLAGHSSGAWFSAIVADEDDSIDAIVAIAPAVFGCYDPRAPENYQRNATLFYPLLENVRRARVMLFFFAGDDCDPGGRGLRSREILTSRGLANLVIDQPSGLGATNHFTAGTASFNRQFGGCILGFISADSIGAGTECRNGKFINYQSLGP